VVPVDDILEHEDCETCWCDPIWDGKNQWDVEEGLDEKIVYVHRFVRGELQ
jgi:hypothetical protein